MCLMLSGNVFILHNKTTALIKGQKSVTKTLIKKTEETKKKTEYNITKHVRNGDDL